MTWKGSGGIQVSNSKRRVLVTGATGFLGRNVLQALLTREDVIPIAACRQPQKLLAGFHGEVRCGDLRDATYRRDVTKGVDVICHAGTWASLWNHAELEQRNFYLPAVDLVEHAIANGVRRFVLTSTVTIANPTQRGEMNDDFAPLRYTGFWPHLDRLIDLDNYLRKNTHRGMQMTVLRLGHFIGKGNRLGILPALLPRLRTYLVPWLDGGRRHVPLIADEDAGQAFALAAVATGLENYESFNIVGAESPTMREVLDIVAFEAGLPRPLYSVSYSLGYAFGRLMEILQPLLPGTSPFLTRSIVHLSENWECTLDYAHSKLGFVANKNWRVALREQLAELELEGYPWLHLAQTTR
jgi:2-alkyl-3-oxoalkanoate reductase